MRSIGSAFVAARAALLGVLLFLSSTAGSAVEPPVFKEYELKAAYLFNFAKFVEWPGKKGEDAGAPIVLGILGHDPFGARLDDLVRDRRINGREIVVRRFETPAEARAVHVLFIGKDAHLSPWDALGTIRGNGVLTVGESPSFAAHGGIITFVIDDGRLAFEIDMDEADRAGIGISAQLQKLARTVRRR
jgi:hypothetical protein